MTATVNALSKIDKGDKQDDTMKDFHEQKSSAGSGGNNNNKNTSSDQKKRRKRRKKKQQSNMQSLAQKNTNQTNEQEDLQVEYVGANMISQASPHFDEFSKIFSKFLTPEQLTNDDSEEDDDKNNNDENYLDEEESDKMNEKGTIHDFSGVDIDDNDADNFENNKEIFDENGKPLSKRKLKKKKIFKVAKLKQTVERPDVVEIHDITSKDPKLLVYLKSYRNTVPVPRHWSQKRKYLQGKRGIEKPPFKLPEFIRKTGITELRDSYRQREEEKKSKQKMRERMTPKMGKIDIDYHILHDAFFKYQTKPKMTIHGDIYFEGKENEIKLQHLKPGFLSERLRNALGMPTGAPPPWLINMQRHGPPPSYPSLKIPGLNAPIPEGASWGYQPGGWGRPPVDDTGKLIYGNVFRNKDGAEDASQSLASMIDEDMKGHWGKISVEEEEEEENEETNAMDEDSDHEDEESMKKGQQMMQQMLVDQGLLESGITSVPMTGITTPDAISLRKQQQQQQQQQQ